VKILTEPSQTVCVAPMPVAARAKESTDGQFDHVQLAPGLRATLRITSRGDIVLTIPGGELTITAGACTLGLGLLEASRRAAQIRVRREARARRTPRRARR
jgi:predicted metal-dependent phosphoesterase TrpH